MISTKGQIYMSIRRWTLPAVLLIATLLSACAGNGPYNSTTEGADANLMLKGHDPVAYFTLGKHTPGSAAIRTEHEGAIYRFVSDANKAVFLKEPAKYVPQFGGFCANGIAYGIPWGGDPDNWKIIDGKLYIFGGESSRNYFLMDEKANLARAEHYWADEMKGQNALVQRYKRLVFRVPHYQTGKELETEWQKRQLAK